MDFDKYCKMVQCKVSMYLGSEYEVMLRKVPKNNGVVLTGIMAQTKGNSVCPTLYVDEYYDEKLSADEVEYISLKLANGLKSVPPEEYPDVSEFMDFDKANSRIVYKLINAEDNKELLFNTPHRRFHNLAIVYFYIVDSDMYGGRATILIKNEHMEEWNTDEETLFSYASKNTPRLFKDKLNSISSVLNELCEIEFEDEVNMYVLTNEAKMYGAATMLYDDVLKEAYEKIGGNYYILPSSIHELVIVPDNSDIDEKELLQMVISINHTEVDEEERLADSLYFYNHDTNSVEWIC